MNDNDKLRSIRQLTSWIVVAGAWRSPVLLTLPSDIVVQWHPVRMTSVHVARVTPTSCDVVDAAAHLAIDIGQDGSWSSVHRVHVVESLLLLLLLLVSRRVHGERITILKH